MKTFHLLHVFGCHSGNSAHALHEVEDCAFGTENIVLWTAEFEHNVTYLYGSAVLNENVELKVFGQVVADCLCHFNASDYTILFYK